MRLNRRVPVGTHGGVRGRLSIYESLLLDFPGAASSSRSPSDHFRDATKMIPAVRCSTVADLGAVRSPLRTRERPPVPYTASHFYSAAVLAASRRIGGFFFAQNRPVFFLCRIFDPANFSRPGSPEAIF